MYGKEIVKIIQWTCLHVLEKINYILDYYFSGRKEAHERYARERERERVTSVHF